MRYNVVEVKLAGGKVATKIVSKNLTKGEASRIETSKNEEALKAYDKAQREGQPAPVLAGYIVQPTK